MHSGRAAGRPILYPAGHTKMGILVLMRPGRSLALATDVLAGFCAAAEGFPKGWHAAASVPFLFASAALLGASEGLFDACLGGKAYVPSKRTFLLGAVLAAGGIIAAMVAGVSVGKLPAYFAAFMFLISWARAGRGPDAVLGPLASGAWRAFAICLGASAHTGMAYLVHPEPFIAAGLASACGALTESIDQAEREGGRRYILLFAAAGILAVFGAASVLLMRRPIAWIVAASGAALVLTRAAYAVRTLLPEAIRRFAEGTMLGSCFLSAGICFGRWPATGAVLVMGAAALVMVLICAALFERYPHSGLPILDGRSP